MILSFAIVLGLLFAHWVGDFVLQTDQQARSKATSNRWLTVHVGIYTATIVIVVMGMSMGGVTTDYRPYILAFALVNGVLHWITDYFTSRWTARLWKAERRHNFFVAIGADQLIHMVTLTLTAALLL